MLAFGPDGYLYLGVGDGGAGNDPPNNAQNIDVLLGKILRIDVDRQDPLFGNRYAAPADNPFVNAPGPRRDLRDRLAQPVALQLRSRHRRAVGRRRRPGRARGSQRTGRQRRQLRLARLRGDVLHEQRSDAVQPGELHRAALRLRAHGGGRCSITGGYVYRGSRGALPTGTYVYGDFCTGEIFAWNGAAQALLLDTAMSISSFGEDEQGELYVVDLGGTVSRIVDASAGDAAIEYFHAGFDHYFSTSLAVEIAALDAGVFSGWARTGQSFSVDPVGTAGNANVCRFFSASFAPKSSHFYTPVASECEIVKGNPRWQFEGEVFSVTLPDDIAGTCPAATIPLYRMYNDGQSGAPNHRYTTSLDMRAAMLAQGLDSRRVRRDRRDRLLVAVASPPASFPRR